MCSNKAAGFTLIELIVLIVIVSVALAGILLMYSTSLRGSADPLSTKQALAAAEALLEEIQLTAFCNPSGGDVSATTQANRQNFDDVSQYDTLATAGIHTIDGGAPIAGLESYNVSVTVSNAAFGGIAAADSKLITVTVTGPTNLPNAATVTHSGYRIDYAGVCP
jgi:MSHA pilin protein MshD